MTTAAATAPSVTISLCGGCLAEQSVWWSVNAVSVKPSKSAIPARGQIGHSCEGCGMTATRRVRIIYKESAR